jgi:hypothetical protein
MMNVAIPKKIHSDPWENYHSTILQYRKGGYVCKFCSKHARTFYHIRSNEDIYMCDCEGAKEVGFDTWDLVNRGYASGWIKGKTFGGQYQ